MEEFLGVERKRDYWEWIVVLKNCYYILDLRGKWVPTGLCIPMTGFRIPAS